MQNEILNHAMKQYYKRVLGLLYRGVSRLLQFGCSVVFQLKVFYNVEMYAADDTDNIGSCAQLTDTVFQSIAVFDAVSSINTIDPATEDPITVLQTAVQKIFENYTCPSGQVVEVGDSRVFCSE